jgi:hypothetical protein
MATLFHQSGSILLSVKHLWQKHKPDGPYYYRCRIPKDILALDSSLMGTFKIVALRTKDLALASQKIIKLTRNDDEMWFRIRNGITPDDTYGEAADVLASFGLGTVPSRGQRGVWRLLCRLFRHRWRVNSR